MGGGSELQADSLEDGEAELLEVAVDELEEDADGEMNEVANLLPRPGGYLGREAQNARDLAGVDQSAREPIELGNFLQ